MLCAGDQAKIDTPDCFPFGVGAGLCDLNGQVVMFFRNGRIVGRVRQGFLGGIIPLHGKTRLQA